MMMYHHRDDALLLGPGDARYVASLTPRISQTIDDPTHTLGITRKSEASVDS